MKYYFYKKFQKQIIKQKTGCQKTKSFLIEEISFNNVNY